MDMDIGTKSKESEKSSKGLFMSRLHSKLEDSVMKRKESAPSRSRQALDQHEEDLMEFESYSSNTKMAEESSITYSGMKILFSF